MKKKVKVDREFQSLIPPLTPDEYKQLEANLIADGCRDPLVTWQGVLLDGHNRLEICNRLGIEYQTVPKLSINNRTEAKDWIITNQLGRRNLQPFQRAELALKLKPSIEAAAKEKYNKTVGRPKSSMKSTTKSTKPIDTRKTLAEKAGVSEDTIRKAEHIIEHADEETKASLRAGKTTINKEYKKIEAKDQPKPKPVAGNVLDQIAGDVKELRSILRAVDDVRKRTSAIVKKKGLVSAWLWPQMLSQYVHNFSKEIRKAIPHALCPACQGNQCDQCNHTGYVGRTVYGKIIKEKPNE